MKTYAVGKPTPARLSIMEYLARKLFDAGFPDSDAFYDAARRHDIPALERLGTAALRYLVLAEHLECNFRVASSHLMMI